MEVLSQLIDSMGDAVDKLEEAKSKGRISEFNRLKEFILKIQKKIDDEVSK